MRYIDELNKVLEDEENIFNIMRDKCPSIINENYPDSELDTCEYVSPCNCHCLECWTKERI